MLFARSLAYQIAFYATTVVMVVATLPFMFVIPRQWAMAVVRAWSDASVWLLRWIAGTRVEVRGRENLVNGPSIVASKHQSMFETIALFPLLSDPAMVMKEEITRIPIFGAYTARAGMIALDRRGGADALRRLVQHGRTALAGRREVVIFPEGTRRAPGAEPRYQSGIALLYRQLDVPVVPVALNSGLYWPKRGFFRHPGTIVIQFLPAIEPGLNGRAFLARLSESIEAASDGLIAEVAAGPDRPPFPPEARRFLTDYDPAP